MKFKFFQHFHPNILRNIDSEMKKEVIPFVKAFNTLPSQIQDESNKFAETLNPISYFSRLETGWKKHNETAILIDDFLDDYYSGRITISSDKVIERAHELLKQAFNTEHEKRVFSAGVKIALERYITEAIYKYKLSNEEVNILITPGVVNYWAYYKGEHLKFLLAKQTESESYDVLQRTICKTFHAEEVIVLNARLERDFVAYENDIQKIRDDLSEYECLISRVEEFRIKGVYLTLGRSDLRYIQKIMAYDNLEEYLFGSNLFGIPDLYLRRLLIKKMVEAKILEEKPGVLFYKEDELLSGVKEFMTEQKNQSTRKFPSVYRQTTNVTCGVACTMMALNYFLDHPLSKEIEDTLYEKLRLENFDIVPAISLASFMAENGLDVTVKHQDEDKFWNFLSGVNKELYQKQKDAYEKAKSFPLKFDYSAVTEESIIHELKENRVVIYGIFLSNYIKHALLIYMYSNGLFYGIDPLSGKRTYSAEKLMEIGDLNTGRWFISIGLPNIQKGENHDH